MENKVSVTYLNGKLTSESPIRKILKGTKKNG